jgi:hypothetical protein
MFDFITNDNWQGVFAVWIWIPVCLALFVYWVIKIKRSFDEELRPNRYELEDSYRGEEVPYHLRKHE